MTPGTRLGPYEVTAKLGEGGMGEVWRATDTRLGREVALKLLPADFADDPERHARFEREARTLASLNHPNIAILYGLEHLDGQHVLVMELVEGEGLEELIARGPIPVDEALPIARQIAEALEAAHEHGIVHRDLKPANVRIRPDGTVKVLDFGLAKAWAEEIRGGDLSLSPTITARHTKLGVILGTAAYMAPEQAKGKAVDKRADIWAFGVVLHEMLTGRRLFDGDSVPETLAGVLKTEIDLGALPNDLPPAIRRLLRRCLERDPGKRLRDFGDAKLELEDEESGTPDAGAPGAGGAPRRPGWLLPALATVALVAGFGLARVLAPRSAAPAGVRLTLALPADAPLAAGNFLPSLAFSPDGRSLAYVAVGTDGARRLAVRRLDSTDATVVPGTEGAEGPFFSPDGEWIGFWSKWKVRKVRASGVGVPEVVCRSLDFRGGTWAGHTIIFAPSQAGPLVRVDDRGGTPRTLTKLLPGEWNHRFPQALPDGDTILYTAWKTPFDVDRSTLFALSLKTGRQKQIGTTSHDVVYSPAGYLLYAQAGRLLAVPFDPEKLEITGPARAILDRVVVQKNTGAAQFAVSPTSELAWAAGELVGDKVRLIRVDRGGKGRPILEADTPRRYPRLSPDDRSFLVEAIGPEVNGEWLVSIDGRSQRRLRRDTYFARWLPDGRWVYSDASRALFVDSVDGSSPSRKLGEASSAGARTTTGVTSDGKVIAYDTFGPTGDLDAWIVDAKGGKPQPFLTAPANDGGVTFSPDGRYAAYVSDRSGDFEVYVTSYPDKAATWQVSTAGGSEVVWRRDGKEIVFRSGNQLMAVPVTTEPTFHAGGPSVLFPIPYDGVLGSPDVPDYDESRDGSWFLMTDNSDLNQPAAHIEIALDWPAVVAGK